jgi:hypothetical protein
MLKETIHFTDFNGDAQTTVEYFNLTKNEIIDLENSIEGGLANMMRRVEDNPTLGGILDLLKKLTHASYGLKSDDGKYFDKSPEITNRFIRSAFYDDFLFDLVDNDAAKGLAFIKGIIPAQLLDAAERQLATNQASAQAAQQYQPDARAQFAAAQAQRQSLSEGMVQDPVVTKAIINQEATKANTPQQYDLEAYLAWKASQESASQPAEVDRTEPEFRVRESDPNYG